MATRKYKQRNNYSRKVRKSMKTPMKKRRLHMLKSSRKFPGQALQQAMQQAQAQQKAMTGGMYRM